MVDLLDYLLGASEGTVLVTRIVLLILFIIVFNVLINAFRRNLLKTTHGKKHISNVQIFTKMLKYIVFIVVAVLFFLEYTDSLGDLGLIFGLLSAALGFALQRPITSVAAWIMVVIKRPFEIGDRVIVGDVKGDVTDITLSHIYLNEAGKYGEEESTGRNVLIPNYLLFERNIINYSMQDDFILGEVMTSITYESDLDKAIEMIMEASKPFLEKYETKVKKEPYIRTQFDASSVNVHLRFFTPFTEIQEISSNITKAVYDRVKVLNNVEIAYPHTEVVFRKKYATEIEQVRDEVTKKIQTEVKHEVKKKVEKEVKEEIKEAKKAVKIKSLT